MKFTASVLLVISSFLFFTTGKISAVAVAAPEEEVDITQQALRRGRQAMSDLTKGEEEVLHFNHLLSPTDGTAESIRAMVMRMIDNGLDRRQIMGILKSKGYTDDKLREIFRDHAEDNNELLLALQPLIGDTDYDNHHDRHLVTTSAVEKTRRTLTAEEFQARLNRFEENADAKFFGGGASHRDLQSACNNIIPSEIGSEIAKAYQMFTSEVDMEDIMDLYDQASSVGEKRAIAWILKNHPMSRIMSCVAETLDTTISVEYSADSTVLFFNADFGLNIIYGEEGQFAVAHTTGFGFDLGLLGVGIAAGVSMSNRVLHGGFDTVASSLKDPDICFAVGYTPFVVGGAVTFALTPSAVSHDHEDTVVDRLSRILSNDKFETKDMLELLLALDPLGGGLTSVGLEATIGLDVLDLVGAKLVLPDLSITACSEELLICDGKGCQEKLMVESWDDGSLCGLGTTCNNCENEATYWWSKALTACGNEPKWSDGSICGLGTTCNACRNEATYWYEKAFTACGPEPKWNDGSICALGTTCNACRNPATYWWGKAFTACGSEPKWNDGTRCLLGTSCNACKNSATWWDSDFGHHCGNEPCWGGGTVCGTGTTCNNCCRGANCPWYQFGVCTCK